MEHGLVAARLSSTLRLGSTELAEVRPEGSSPKSHATGGWPKVKHQRYEGISGKITVIGPRVLNRPSQNARTKPNGRHTCADTNPWAGLLAQDKKVNGSPLSELAFPSESPTVAKFAKNKCPLQRRVRGGFSPPSRSSRFLPRRALQPPEGSADHSKRAGGIQGKVFPWNSPDRGWPLRYSEQFSR